MLELVRPIRLRDVRQNNLKGITVEIPYRKLTIVTGVSGSGKSSLAFETLYAEGQRRYVESLSTYTRQFLEKMPRPEVESVENIPPAIALEQRNHVVNSRSTVGTLTETVDYLRVLFAKLGQTSCMSCGGKVEKIDASAMLQAALEFFPGRRALLMAPFDSARGELSHKKKRATKPLTSTESIKIFLAERGFSRILLENEPRLLEEFSDKEPLPPLIDVVVDRLKLPASGPTTDARARLRDSVDQAFGLGHGRLSFVDLDKGERKDIKSGFACLQCGREHMEPEPNLFSFNNPIGACAHCSGFGYTLDLDERLIVPDPTKTLKNGAIDPFSKPSFLDWQTSMFKFAERNGVSIGKRYEELSDVQKKLLWDGSGDKEFPGIRGCFDELSGYKYKLHIRVFIRRYQAQNLCRLCKGSRLRQEALAVKIQNMTLPEILKLPIEDSLSWFATRTWNSSEKKVAQDILEQITRRLVFLNSVGVGYLTLDRLAKTLSGGEFQRINLATQLGNGLCGTLYVLDEPSIGLHAADTQLLIGVLRKLRDQGNTVVVVEHDLEIIRAGDWLLELGPGAGNRGGNIVAAGSPKQIEAVPDSLTAKYLLSDAGFGERPDGPNLKARGEIHKWLKITGCRANNLKNLTVKLPLERFVVVTGVSGSGKSTFLHKTVCAALQRIYDRDPTIEAGPFEKLEGFEYARGAVLLDQKPIGRTSRSNPATYLKIWEEIRRLLANQALALRRGYTPQHFSFNVDGGRCPTCSGEGEITVDMHFMAEVKLPCEECRGARFKKQILDIEYRGRNVQQILGTTVDEAYDLFRSNPVIARKLDLLRSVGLGYIQLGQSGTTLSGGESQRIKIAAALDQLADERLIYIFDEPTTGLHMEDIRKLLLVLQDLVDAKNSVLMVEHHLDVIAQADWVIDLGPGGGGRGGELVASGPPQLVREHPISVTGRLLRETGRAQRAQRDSTF